MVLPLLYGLGARDFLEPIGFVLMACQKCATTGPFVAYEAKRKVTFYAVPTISVRERLVVECHLAHASRRQRDDADAFDGKGQRAVVAGRLKGGRCPGHVEIGRGLRRHEYMVAARLRAQRHRQQRRLINAPAARHLLALRYP